MATLFSNSLKWHLSNILYVSEEEESIIDGCLFVRSIVMKKIETKQDLNVMENVVSRIKQQGLYRLGNRYSDVFEEQLVEEFYQNALVHFHSLKKGGDIADTIDVVCGVEIRIDRELLKDIFGLPSYGLNMEELESFGSEELLTTFWGLFTGDSSHKKVLPSCHKK